jgi:hypothetical protein
VCVCACVRVPHLKQLLNASTSLYELQYMYHDNRAHLNGLLHTFLPSVTTIVQFLKLLNSLIVTLRLKIGRVERENMVVARQRFGKLVPVA